MTANPRNSKALKHTASGLAILLMALAFLAYQYQHSPFRSDVFVVFPDGEIRQVSPATGGVFYEANIHPNGTHVVFFGATTGAPQIWMTDLTSFEAKPLTQPSYGARHPSFSYDGEHIVFSSDKGFDDKSEKIESMGKEGVPPEDIFTNIFVMDKNGSNIRQLTSGPYQDQRPVFSPDNKSIAFVSNRSGEIRIWKLDLDDQNGEPEILIQDRYAYRPIFSPEGQWLYFFIHASPQHHQICRIRLVNKEYSCLENDDRGYSHGPFVTPDGKSVLMHSTRGGNWGIWKLPLDGSSPLLIQPPGFRNALHPTISKNGIMAFDTLRKQEPVETLLGLKYHFFK